jgi:serine protease
MRAERVANDPLFGDQFYLAPGTTTIDAPAAWDLTIGSPSTVVAVLDTGSTNHADLAGRLLPGYDFVANFATSNDGNVKDANGNYRDSDAADPGDWVTAADQMGNFAGCPVRNSTWHGTSVMGVIAANADNGMWLTGVDWNAKILPVRVLGKCNGDDTDVADGLAWAGGLAVPAAPVNATPAHIINMSLGDPGPCTQYFQDSINAVLAHGITRAIVASAGNENSGGAHYPSDCTGVISVGASTFSGTRAVYSNYGPRVDISAPGGNNFAGSPYNILTIINSGTTVPVGDSSQYRAGTSFSAPLVSGVVALMLSVAPNLTATQVRDFLKASAKPFPAGSNCTPGTCGAGMLDAPGAVRQALVTTGTPVPVTIVEFYNVAFDHYFITWVPAEIALLDAGTTIKGWTRTGKTFTVLQGAVAGTSPVCRIYIPPGKGDGHYFGRDKIECDGTMAKNPTFILEAPEFFFLYPTAAGNCATGTVPVYRVYSNRPDANHRYTIERAVRDQMVASGWLAEGDGPDIVVMCAPA